MRFWQCFPLHICVFPSFSEASFPLLAFLTDHLNGTIMMVVLLLLLCLVSQSCPTLCDPMDCSPPDSSVHRDSPGKHTRVGCHALLQGIFPTQGLNSGLLHCRWILYHLSHQGSLCPSTLRYKKRCIHIHTTKSNARLQCSFQLSPIPYL